MIAYKYLKGSFAALFMLALLVGVVLIAIRPGVNDYAEVVASGMNDSSKLVASGMNDSAEVVASGMNDSASAEVVASGMNESAKVVASGMNESAEVVASGMNESAKVIASGMNESAEVVALDTPTTIACNVIGVSSFQPRSPVVFETHNISSVLEVSLVGRFGNHLSIYGGRISEGLDTGVPLEYQPNPNLPHLAEIMVEEKIGKLSSQIPQTDKYYQSAAAIDNIVKHRSDLCYYLAMPLHLRQFPKPNDVVIHFRDFSTSRRLRERQLKKSQVFIAIDKQDRLECAPTIYYDRILEAGNYDAIWLVAEPKVRHHPIVQGILSKYPGKAVVHDGTPEEDFQFVSFAPNIILSPSTFGWWAAFFAQGGNGVNTTIHLPVMPWKMPISWCNFFGSSDGFSKNVVYHDWFSNKTVNTLDEALQICRMYGTKAPNISSVAAHYPELN